MSYNILGINMGQHGSATLLSDGVPIYFLEEGEFMGLASPTKFP